MSNNFINDLVKPSDFGIERLLEPEEIDQLTVAEYKVYERKLKAYRDYYSTVYTAYIRGYQQAYNTAIKSGRKEQAIRIIQNMKADEIPTETIAEFTGLTEELVNAL